MDAHSWFFQVWKRGQLKVAPPQNGLVFSKQCVKYALTDSVNHCSKCVSSEWFNQTNCTFSNYYCSSINTDSHKCYFLQEIKFTSSIRSSSVVDFSLRNTKRRLEDQREVREDE